MNYMKTTIGFVVAAAVLCALALLTAPRHAAPDAFFDEGEPFFPEFTDPNMAKTLEVIEYDAETGSARPFKVTFKNGRWTIPSHHDYPADAKDQLAQTAAGVIGITKDDFRTDNVADHAACGVIDPLDDANPSVHGRGQRVTIKGDNDVVLADFIVGKAMEGREGFGLVRVPGQKRVYGVRMKIDISTDFADWIDPDLMMIEQTELDRAVLKDYSIDERTGRLDERDVVTLDKGDDDQWSIDKLAAGKEVDKAAVSNLVRAVDELAIVGVRPKPEGITATLEQVRDGAPPTDAAVIELQRKGFYFTRDGRLVSNEGELIVRTADGVTFTLRFGEVVFGSGLAVSAGTSQSDREGTGENRYLMITAAYDPSVHPEPEPPSDLGFETKADSLWTEADYTNKGKKAEHDRWAANVASAKARAEDMNQRFGPWYYVISSESFDKIHLRRTDLLRDQS